MTQGYELYARDADGRAYVEARRDLKVAKVRLNEKLPDDLFKIELKKGIEITDSRSGRDVTYFYEPEPPTLTGKILPDLGNIKCESSSSSNSMGMTLLCFWDMNQRPSRHCLQQLSEKAQQLKDKNIAVVAVHTKADEKILDDWIKENNIPFPVGLIEDDEEQIRNNWGVKSLPWMILTDENRVVAAEGFAVSELDAQIKG